MFYAPINYYTTISRGYPLYWFLTWEDYKTPLIIMLISTVAIGYFQLLAAISYTVKPLKTNETPKQKSN